MAGLCWAFGFLTVAGLTGSRWYLLGAAAVAALGIIRARKVGAR